MALTMVSFMLSTTQNNCLRVFEILLNIKKKNTHVNQLAIQWVQSGKRDDGKDLFKLETSFSSLCPPPALVAILVEASFEASGI